MVKKKSKNIIRKYINQRKKQNFDKFTKIFTVTLLMSALGLSLLNAFNSNFRISWLGAVSISISIGITLFKEFYDTFTREDTLVKCLTSIIILGLLTFIVVHFTLWLNNILIHESLNSVLKGIAYKFRHSIPRIVNLSQKYIYPLIRCIIFFSYDSVCNFLIILVTSLLSLYFSRLLLIWVKKIQN